MISFPGPAKKDTGTEFIVFGDTSLKMYPTAMEEGSASLLAAERTWDGNVSHYKDRKGKYILNLNHLVGPRTYMYVLQHTM